MKIPIEVWEEIKIPLLGNYEQFVGFVPRDKSSTLVRGLEKGVLKYYLVSVV